MANRDDPTPRPPTTGDLSPPETTGVRFSPLDAERQGVVNLSDKHGVPGVDVRVVPLDLTDLDLIPRDLARRHCVLPLLQKGDALFLAMGDPGNRQAQTEIEFVTGRRVLPFAADAEALGDLIDRAYDLRARGGTELAPERPSVGPPPQGTRPSSQTHVIVRGATLPPPLRRARMGTLLDPAPPPAMRPGAQPSPVEARGPEARSPSPNAPFAPPGQGAASIIPLKSPSNATSAPRRALVVDADGRARAALREALTALGLSVTEAGTVREAFAMVCASAPAVMVIDPDLPDEHGFELVRRMRENGELSEVPVVVASARYCEWRSIQDLKAVYGVRAVVDKPLVPADFAVRVSEAIAPAGSALEEMLPAEASAAMQRSTEAWQRADIRAAVAHLEQAITAAPDSYRLRYHLGLAFGRGGDGFRAIREMERSVALNDRFFPSLKNLAVLYERVGFRHKALEAWERACPVAPDEATLEQIKERVLALLF